MLVDISAAELLDRLDWSDPNFPAICAAFDLLSFKVQYRNGHHAITRHIIQAEAAPSEGNE